MGGREWAAKWAEVQPDTLKMGQVEGQIKLKLNAVHILFNLSHAPLEKSNYYVLANTGGNSTVCLAAKQETCLPPPPPPLLPLLHPVQLKSWTRGGSSLSFGNLGAPSLR